LSIVVKYRVVVVWLYMISGDNNKLSYTMYTLIYVKYNTFCINIVNFCFTHFKRHR